MILASQSPRRKEILSNFGFKIKVKVKEIEEKSNKKTIIKQIEDIANQKSEIIAKEYLDEYVLGADTVVVLKEEILGKPKTKEKAREMLGKLSGKTHQVITAYSLINKSKEIKIVGHNITNVHMKKIGKKELEWYIETEESLDKAGGYGIQGKAAIFIDKIEGDFFNVMGFPLSEFIEQLRKNNYSINKIINL